MSRLKVHEVRQNGAQITNGASLVQQSLVYIPQGTGYEKRVGRWACVKRLDFDGFIIFPSQQDLDTDPQDLANLAYIVTIDLVVDKQANGTAGTAAEIWAPGYDGTTIDPTSLRNVDNTQRFTILRSWRFDVSPEARNMIVNSAGNGYVNQAQCFTKSLRLHTAVDIPILYDKDSTGTPDITELPDNNIMMFARMTAVGDNGSASATNINPNFYGNWRIRYEDETSGK